MRADGLKAYNYKPKARPPPPYDNISFWEMLRSKEKGSNANNSGWLEVDLNEYSKFAVEKLTTEGDDTALKSLYHTSISGKLSHL